MAWTTACYLQNRMPTVTAYGYMTLFGNVRGLPPSLKRLRIWECKAYVLKPKAVRRKDFDDKAYCGFHAGYAGDARGYEIYIPELDKSVTSAYIFFNEVIPSPTDEYYRELQRLKIVMVVEPPRDPATYQYLTGLDHLDDEDTPHASDTRDELVPVHIADICRMTDDVVQSRKASTTTLDQELRPVSNGSSEPPSQRISRDNMELAEDTGVIRRVRVNTECVLHSSPGAPPPFRNRKGLSENLSTGNRRVVNPGRACKSTNVVYTLQEEGTVPPPDVIAPSSYRAAINSAEADDWRNAIRTKLSTLQTERRCWRYVQYPPRGTPILRCHFVFKKKKHLGQVARFKARLVVDGRGQRKEVNFSETFVLPVVK
jgi:hypothetical protein